VLLSDTSRPHWAVELEAAIQYDEPSMAGLADEASMLCWTELDRIETASWLNQSRG
jgi:hypothetical protein